MDAVVTRPEEQHVAEAAAQSSSGEPGRERVRVLVIRLPFESL